MASFSEAFAAFEDFKMAVLDAQHNEEPLAALSAFSVRGGLSAFLTPLTNIHAIGVGIRLRGGQVVENDFVLKVFVFDKLDLGNKIPDILGKPFHGIGIDIEHLPIQQALIHKNPAPTPPSSPSTPGGSSTSPFQHQQRQRPIAGGLQISPLHTGLFGTLGCLVRRGSSLFALSNNHVLTATNNLAVGTPIVQPSDPSATENFALLSDFEPIRFPGTRGSTPVNTIDAAIAAITDSRLVAPGKMFGVSHYTPQLLAPMPAMNVVKSGRTTGVTRGMITSISVSGVKVNYGTVQSPMIAIFDNCIQISGTGGQTFSLPGDSGSAILDAASGRPVALLFAGDGRTTTACNLSSVCSRFSVIPA